MTRYPIMKWPIPIALLFGVAACSHYDMTIGGRTFHDMEEAVAHQESLNAEAVSAIEPLPAPIAGPAIIVVPTRDQLETFSRRAEPGMSEDEIQAYTTMVEDGWMQGPRLVERRNIFESTTVVRNQSTSGIVPPSDGYLMWFEVLYDVSDAHMMAAGESQMTKLNLTGVNDPTGRRFLEEVEAFVAGERSEATEPPVSTANSGREEGIAAFKRGDYAMALRELAPLAEEGDADAQSILGVMYERGWGVRQDYTESVKWYRKAAEKGVVVAQANLGVMYDYGQGIAQDYGLAVTWYHKAAEQGHAKAQNNLGTMYGNGRGVPRDLARAYFWFTLAAAGGNRTAASNRRMAAKSLSSEQITEADRLVSEWKPTRE